jgi:signal transduction histidine kinase
VFFGVGEGKAVLEVRDNGIGLDGKRGSGRGLQNMKSRAAEIGGSCAILSENGTRVRLEFPLP